MDQFSGGTSLDDFSFEYGLPEDSQHQANWRRCSKCQALYWAVDQNDSGLCPASGNHEPTEPTFRVLHISVEEDPKHQANWRFCRKCFTLFWDGDEVFKGRCPVDHGSH